MSKSSKLFACSALSLAFAGALVGCGGGSGSDSIPVDLSAPAQDAPDKHDVPPEASASNLPAPAVASDTVANKTVQPRIEFAPSIAVNSSTVNNKTVTVQSVSSGEAIPKTVEGKVSYDATNNTITFETTDQLPLDAKIRVSVSGVIATDGKSLPAYQFNATANSSAEERLARFASGAVTGYLSRTKDANGNPQTIIGYRNAGTDGLWFTADDVIARSVTYKYNGENRLVGYLEVVGSGTDQMWGTADDVVAYAYTRSYDANGKPAQAASYSGPGPDGKWLTPDDTIRYYETYSYEANGAGAQITAYSGPGVDGIWLTADDAVRDYRHYEFDADGTAKIIAIFTGAGVDGLWFTADDYLRIQN